MKNIILLFLVLTLGISTNYVMGRDQYPVSTLKKKNKRKKMKIKKAVINKELTKRFQSEVDSSRGVASGDSSETLENDLNKKIQGQYEQDRDISREVNSEKELEEGNSPVDNNRVKRWKYGPEEDNLE